MKCAIAFACLLAVASAGYINAPIAYAGYGYNDGYYRGEGLFEGAYKGEGLIESQDHSAPVAAVEARIVDPVAVAAGAPLPVSDTVEVAAAKAAHFRAHAAAKGLAYAHPVAHTYGAHYAHPYGAHYAHAYAAPLASEARLVDPVAIAAGAPLPTGDTVEVAHAKAVHFQAHAAAKGLSYAHPVAHTYGAHYAHPYGAHYAHAYAAPLASEARQVDPVAIAAGAPLPEGDTYEVAAAKAFHHAAHHEAKTSHFLAKGHFIAKRSPVYLSTAYTSPIHSYGYSAYASPLGYSAYNNYGYGRFGSYYL